MKQYPLTITPQILARTAHISDAEVVQDITDTMREINNLKDVRDAERVIAEKHPDPAERKMADFKAGARDGQIAERQAFVDYLVRLQQARAARALGMIP